MHELALNGVTSTRSSIDTPERVQLITALHCGDIMTELCDYLVLVLVHVFPVAKCQPKMLT